MSKFVSVSPDNQVHNISSEEGLKAFCWGRDINKYSCYMVDSGILKQVIVNSNLSVEPFYKLVNQ